jgi:hypothetical protein
MRFALVATAVASAIAVPLAVSAGAPQMSSDQFINAVRCVAYEDVAGDQPLSEAKWQLNAEARRQSPETAARAQAEVSTIARQAEAGPRPSDHAAACAGALLATVADSRDAA